MLQKMRKTMSRYYTQGTPKIQSLKQNIGFITSPSHKYRIHNKSNQQKTTWVLLLEATLSCHWMKLKANIKDRADIILIYELDTPNIFLYTGGKNCQIYRETDVLGKCKNHCGLLTRTRHLSFKEMLCIFFRVHNSFCIYQVHHSPSRSQKYWMVSNVRQFSSPVYKKILGYLTHKLEWCQPCL